jgi:hypothetical protein
MFANKDDSNTAAEVHRIDKMSQEDVELPAAEKFGLSGGEEIADAVPTDM